MTTEEDLLTSFSIREFQNKLKNYKCTKCPLQEEAWAFFGLENPVCIWKDFSQTDLLVIGDKPSEADLHNNLLFSNEKDSILLKHLITTMHEINKEIKIDYLNSCMCPTIEDKSLTLNQVESCSLFLKKQISLIKPSVIICAGKDPLWSLFSEEEGIKRKTLMKDLVGKKFNLQISGHKITIPTFAVYHPAYLHRKQIDGQVPSKLIEKYKQTFKNAINIAWRYRYLYEHE